MISVIILAFGFVLIGAKRDLTYFSTDLTNAGTVYTQDGQGNYDTFGSFTGQVGAAPGYFGLGFG